MCPNRIDKSRLSADSSAYCETVRIKYSLEIEYLYRCFIGIPVQCIYRFSFTGIDSIKNISSVHLCFRQTFALGIEPA